MCVSACVCLHVCAVPVEDARFLGTGVMDGCELQCQWWELNPGPLHKQQMFLTTEIISPFPKNIFISCIYMFAYMYMGTPCTCLVPEELRGRCDSPGTGATGGWLGVST